MASVSGICRSKLFRIASVCIVAASVAGVASQSVFARSKNETIEATAWGTGAQMGQNIGVTMDIYEFSTPADRITLLQAFQKSKNQGLVNALQKMKAVGHVSLTGTLGYDCSFIRMTPTPTGRKIVFITNRQISFAESYADSQSQSYNLTAGILEINDQDKSKSTGTLYPAAMLTLNKQNELEWDLTQNPWRLGDVLDWAGTAGVN
jgi:hypothetical protein